MAPSWKVRQEGFKVRLSIPCRDAMTRWRSLGFRQGWLLKTEGPVSDEDLSQLPRT